jgi:hypothetical protein
MDIRNGTVDEFGGVINYGSGNWFFDSKPEVGHYIIKFQPTIGRSGVNPVIIVCNYREESGANKVTVADQSPGGFEVFIRGPVQGDTGAPIDAAFSFIAMSSDFEPHPPPP